MVFNATFNSIKIYKNRLSSFGVTIIFLKFPTTIFLVTRPYMVSRTHTYNKIVQINLAAE